MYKSMKNRFTRMVPLFVIALGVFAACLWFGAAQNVVDASNDKSESLSPAAVFPANAGTLGAIPDGPVGGTVCGDFGAPRDVTFTVSGISTPVSDVQISLTGSHTWLGDLEVTLIAPDNTTTATIFKNVGAATATACGSSSDLGGTYNFFDTAPDTPTFWNAAVTTPVPVGNYRSSAALTGTNTTITNVFSGIPSANGTWTMRVRDGGEGDTGTITGASLTLTGAAAATNAPVDFNGDGKTDFAVVRNVGGGPSGQVQWFYNLNGSGGTLAYDWGISTDFFVPEDYDGDGKTDIAVWRGGAATVAAFYILQSQTNTLRYETFGQTGDDPTVVGDYNGDGKADLAVYRSGATAGAQSTWFYRTTANGPTTYVPWGQNGDFPAPGDYDGDNKNDFAIQRAGGGGGQFWRSLSGGGNDVVNFGTATDVIVPGDYDGDGKTDLAVVRGVGGAIHWWYLPSSGGSAVLIPFGVSATDFTTQGDFDGDGKTDVAVWRNGVFWARNSSNGSSQSFGIGASGDYPVGNFNSH